MEGMRRDAACVLTVYTAVTSRVSLRPPGLSEGPGGLGLSFVKEPRGSCRGRLEHTWQFEPLGRSTAITPNWLWHLAVSLRPKMVCRCALCIGREFGSHGGAERILPEPLMWMIRSETLACSWRGEREQERCPIRPTAGLFLESGTNAFTLPSSSLHPVSFHLCVVAYTVRAQQ